MKLFASYLIDKVLDLIGFIIMLPVLIVVWLSTLYQITICTVLAIIGIPMGVFTIHQVGTYFSDCISKTKKYLS